MEIEYYLNLDALDISLPLPLGYSIMMPVLLETALHQARALLLLTFALGFPLFVLTIETFSKPNSSPKLSL